MSTSRGFCGNKVFVFAHKHAHFKLFPFVPWIVQSQSSLRELKKANEMADGTNFTFQEIDWTFTQKWRLME